MLNAIGMQEREFNFLLEASAYPLVQPDIAFRLLAYASRDKLGKLGFLARTAHGPAALTILSSYIPPPFQPFCYYFQRHPSRQSAFR